MRAEPYLCLGDVELANALRTLTYLRRGLGDTRWEVRLANHDAGGCETTSEIVNDPYHDTYRAYYSGQLVVTTVCDPFWPGNLGCYCAAYDESPYVSPEDDEAPWWSPDRPASSEFLGFIPSKVDVRPSLGRSSTQMHRGAALGPQDAGGQIVAVDGTLYASSADGMDYGTAWLRAQLAGDLCDRDRDLRILPACPGDGRDPDWRNLAYVGLVDGPTIQPVDRDVPECVVSAASFQLLAELPFLLADADVLFEDVPASLQRVSASLGDVLGDAALRFTMLASADATVRVSAYPTSGGACPSLVTTPAWRWTADIPSGMRLTVDAVAGIVELVNPATGETEGGLDALTYTAPFIWPTLTRCSEYCIEVERLVGSVQLTIEQVGRRL